MSLDNIHLSSNENRKTQNLMFYPFSTSSNPNIGHDRFLGLPFKINKGTKCFSLVLKKNGNIEGHNIEDLLLYFKDNNINLNLIKGMVNEKVEKWIGTLTPPNTSKISKRRIKNKIRLLYPNHIEFLDVVDLQKYIFQRVGLNGKILYDNGCKCVLERTNDGNHIFLSNKNQQKMFGKVLESGRKIRQIVIGSGPFILFDIFEKGVGDYLLSHELEMEDTSGKLVNFLTNVKEYVSFLEITGTTEMSANKTWGNIKCNMIVNNDSYYHRYKNKIDEIYASSFPPTIKWTPNFDEELIKIIETEIKIKINKVKIFVEKNANEFTITVNMCNSSGNTKRGLLPFKFGYFVIKVEPIRFNFKVTKTFSCQEALKENDSFKNIEEQYQEKLDKCKKIDELVTLYYQRKIKKKK